MVAASVLLACLAAIADAVTTLYALRASLREANPVRRFLIRTLGVVGGTVGVALAICAVIVVVNLYSKQTTISLVIGNALIAAIFGAAAWHNHRVTK